jgi:hypothetical protein
MFIASVACINQFHGLRRFCTYDVSFPLFLAIYIYIGLCDRYICAPSANHSNVRCQRVPATSSKQC